MNNVYKKSVSLLLCAIMASSGTALALDGRPGAISGVTLSASADTVAPTAASIKAGTTKDETVYIFLYPDGSVRSQTVSGWLHNPDGLRGVAERVNLQNVKNVKSDLAPTLRDGLLSWDTDETDVYYQGQTDLTPPVTMAVSYTLDGQPIAPAELAGRSGRVTITLRFINNTGKSQTVAGETRTVYTPFAVAAVCNLPTDTFKNVSCGDLPLVAEGNNQMVAIAALPGLKESLGDSYDLLRDEAGIELKDTFTITADATDFSMGSILAAVTSDLPLDSLKKAADFSELTDALDDLQAAAGTLQDGTAALADGMGTFAGKLGELAAGIDGLAGGIDALAAGAGQVTTGAADLKAGADALYSGVQTAAGGAKSLQAGAADLKAGAAELQTGAVSLNQNTQTLKAGAAGVSQGVQDYTAAIGQLFAAVMGKLPALEEEMSGVQAAVTEQMNTTAGDLQAAAGDMTQIMTTLSTLIGQIDAMEQTGAADPSVTAPLKTTALTLYDQLNGHIDRLKALGGDLETLSGTARKVAGDLNQQYNQMKEKLVPMQQELTEKSAQLAAGAENLSDGANRLAAGTEQLSGGASSLSGGADRLADGTDTLAAGAGQLESGAADLSAGAGKLAAGTEAAGAGAAALQAGKGQLQSGASQLNQAAGNLRDKTGELRDGMSQFKSDGVDRLHRTAGEMTDQLEELLELRDALVERAESYTSYTGSPEGAQSKVKFVLKTDAIEKETAAETAAAPEKPAKVSFWQRIVNLFKRKD
ncbi:MAG: hypothetical protein HFE86_00940 [Clostridiales bacterium]|nr:hypothetical protein [Clostridiales bacterium]